MPQRLPNSIVFALVMAAIPFIPGMPPFWIVLVGQYRAVSGWWRWALCYSTGVGGPHLIFRPRAAFCAVFGGLLPRRC